MTFSLGFCPGFLPLWAYFRVCVSVEVSLSTETSLYGPLTHSILEMNFTGGLGTLPMSKKSETDPVPRNQPKERKGFELVTPGLAGFRLLIRSPGGSERLLAFGETVRG